jgi:hypothetical protein
MAGVDGLAHAQRGEKKGRMADGELVVRGRVLEVVYRSRSGP